MSKQPPEVPHDGHEISVDASEYALGRVAKMLLSAHDPSSVLPPTALYNEGWMLRLVLDSFATGAVPSHPLGFHPEAIWRSEVLLPSQFLARTRGDLLAESWTHADGVVGHIGRNGRRGDLRLSETARQFVVIEAKMFSGLSAGTKRARTFNQAARNVACIAEVLHVAHRSAAEFDHLGFVLLAPREQIEAGVFGSLCDRSELAAAVRARVDSYGGPKDQWYEQVFLPTLAVLRVDVLAWEDVIATIRAQSSDRGDALLAFYQLCLKFNRRISNLRS